MSDAHNNGDDAHVTAELLSSKAAPAPLFDEREVATIAEHHNRLTAENWEEIGPTRNPDLLQEIKLSLLVQEDEALREVLSTRGPVEGQSIATARPGNPVFDNLGTSPFGCDFQVVSPAYTFGYPPTEHVGSGVTEVATPNAPVHSLLGDLFPSPSDLRTFSQLALPKEGKLSLGVGIEKTHFGNTVQAKDLLYPPPTNIPRCIQSRAVV